MVNTSDKIKIIKYLNENAWDALYYPDLKAAIKCKNDSYILSYLITLANNELKKETLRKKLLLKAFEIIYYLIEIDIPISAEDKKILTELNQVKSENESEIINSIEKINNLLSFKENKFKNETESPLVQLLQEKIDSLQNELENYQNEITKLKEKLDKAKDNSDKKAKRIVSLNSELESCQKEYQNLLKELETVTKNAKEDKQTIEHLNSQIKELIKKIDELTKKCQNSTKKNKKLETSYSEAIKHQEELENQINDQKVQIDILTGKTNPLEKYDSQLLEIIINSLYNKQFIDLKKVLANLGFNLTQIEIDEIINYLKSKLFITNNSLFSSSLSYKIVMPPLLKGSEHKINTSYKCKSMDLMLIADFHIDFKNMDLIYTMYEHILNYCHNNSISYVFNLGDFFDFVKPDTQYTYQNLEQMAKEMDKLIKGLPQCDNITHALLGGNHDEDTTKYGIDWIQYFTSQRPDYFSIGYDHAHVGIINENGYIGNLYFSHPRSQIVQKDLLKCVEQAKEKTGKKFDFHFFGHHHSSFLDTKNQVCIVPSLTRDRVYPGAWHITIHFTNTRISYIEFRPLIFQDKIIPTSSILYRKKS